MGSSTAQPPSPNAGGVFSSFALPKEVQYVACRGKEQSPLHRGLGWPTRATRRAGDVRLLSTGRPVVAYANAFGFSAPSQMLTPVGLVWADHRASFCYGGG